MNILLDQLYRYSPIDDNEISAKEKMISFLNNTARPFHRETEEGHFTSSAWIVCKETDRYLLTHHKIFDDWYQLGGHCDGDSDTLGVSLKEAYEESGLKTIRPFSENIFDIDVHYVPKYRDVPGHFHYDVRYLLVGSSREEIVVSEESHDVRWYDTDPSSLPTDNQTVRRMLGKWNAMKDRVIIEPNS